MDVRRLVFLYPVSIVYNSELHHAMLLQQNFNDTVGKYLFQNKIEISKL